MQVEFKRDDQLKENQLIIKAKELTPEIKAALAFLEEKLAQKITVYQGSDEIILPLASILFFETNDRHVWAHDRESSYLVKQTLRQLEASLPSDFDRASKSWPRRSRSIKVAMKSSCPWPAFSFLRPTTDTSGPMTGKAAIWSSRPCGSWKPACPATLTGPPRVPWSTAGRSMPSSGQLPAANSALPPLTRKFSFPAATTTP